MLRNRISAVLTDIHRKKNKTSAVSADIVEKKREMFYNADIINTLETYSLKNEKGM